MKLSYEKANVANFRRLQFKVNVDGMNHLNCDFSVYVLGVYS